MTEETWDDLPEDDEEDEPYAEEGINAWSDSDLTEEENYGAWLDSQDVLHEIQYGDYDPDTTETRGEPFETYDEAKAYIYEILYGADQYFEIYYTEDGYEVVYMGGTD